MPKSKKESKPPAKLYHGTTEITAKMACVKGLSLYDISPYDSYGLPRTIRASTPDGFCLTTTYPGVMAFDTSLPRERWGVLEIDPTQLEPDAFQPHEWFLVENATKPKMSDEGERFKQLEQFRRDTKQKKRWKESLDELGFCVYAKTIPLAAITKVIVYDPVSNPYITKALTNVNLGSKYHKSNIHRQSMLVRWLMCEHIVGSEWYGSEFSKLPHAEQSKITSVLQNKNGLDIFHSSSTQKAKVSVWG